MNHWTEKYIGMAYVEGELDCLDLVALVMDEVFGRKLDFPKPSRSLGGRAEQIVSSWRVYARSTHAPREGDAVLMRPLGSSLYATHIGLLVMTRDERWVLHNMRGLGVRMDEVGEVSLSRIGHEFVEFCAWI